MAPIIGRRLLRRTLRDRGTSGSPATPICNDGRRSSRPPLRPPERTVELRTIAELRRAALDYRSFRRRARGRDRSDQTLVNQHDLSLAYSPGAAACEKIVGARPTPFATRGGNLVAVITNGTAVLAWATSARRRQAGRGRQGRPVQKFAGIDVFDAEVGERNLDKLIDLIAALSRPSEASTSKDQGARLLRRRAALADEDPGLPRRQHGTAIVVGAGVLNALR